MSKKKKKASRFMILSEAAKELGMDVSTVMRYVNNGKIAGGKHQVYIKVGETFYPVGEKQIKVVDIGKVDGQNVEDMKYKRA